MEKDKLLDHESDGIQEYDNDLPKWWVWLFVITVIWGAGYIVYFHFSDTKPARDTVDAEVAALKEKQAAAQAEAGDSGVEGLQAAIKSPEARTRGKVIYDTRCMACHADKGQGLVGPNLTDQYWLHGGKPEEIRNVIINGVPDKGMISWKSVLTPQEIDDVTSFVVSLKGTNPPNPKAPQGSKVE